MDEYDAVVVGGSIAGSTAATFLGRQGARVALLERSPNEDAYKVICTHAIQASATNTLRRLGLVEQIEAAGGLRNHADFWTRRGWVSPRPPAGVKELPYGYNIRRERFDPMIRSLAASTEGVDYLPGATVTELIRDERGRPGGVRATVGGEDRELQARVVIGADGRDSKVAGLAGLPAKIKRNARFAYFAHYKDLALPGLQPATGWFLEPDAAALFINDGGIAVVACVPHMDRLPEFREDLEGAFSRYFAELPGGPDLSTGRRVTKIMGRLDMSNVRRRASGPGVALVGDAAQATDPLWGVGCGWALQGSEWLAWELEGAFGSDREIDRALARYRRRHRRALAAHHWLISDFATGRPLNPLESMMFTAAARDQHVARAMFRIGQPHGDPTAHPHAGPARAGRVGERANCTEASALMGRLSELQPVQMAGERSRTLLEGPRVTATGDLLFSDVLAGGVYRQTPSGELRTIVPGRRGVGGLVEHERGGVVVGGRDLVHVDDTGVSHPLLARDGVTGFNDLTTTPDGQVIVGALRFHPFASEEPVPGELLLVSGPERAVLLSETLLWPNGIGLSPGNDSLYVSDFARKHVKVMSPDGSDESIFSESPQGSADGLAVDAEGGVWVALGEGGGVARFEPDGSLDEIVEVPANFVSSISFGGSDRHDVLVSTADSTLAPGTGGALFRARSEVAGIAVNPAVI